MSPEQLATGIVLDRKLKFVRKFVQVLKDSLYASKNNLGVNKAETLSLVDIPDNMFESFCKELLRYYEDENLKLTNELYNL